MGIEITESAKEHGFGMADAIHALQTPIVTVDGYGQGRGGHRPPKGWVLRDFLTLLWPIW